MQSKLVRLHHLGFQLLVATHSLPWQLSLFQPQIQAYPNPHERIMNEKVVYLFTERQMRDAYCILKSVQ